MTRRLWQLWRYRALAEILVARELKARYRGTALGFFWSFVNPLMMMSIYFLVFRVYMRIDVPNYPTFLLCGLLPWMAFSAGVVEGMNAIIQNGGIIRKVRLPSEVFPFVSVSHNLVHYMFSLPVLFAIMVASGMHLGPTLLLLPVLMALQFCFTYALALVLASLAVQFRDLVHIIPNIMMVWFYMTPVFYPGNMVPERLRPLIAVNPVSWLIQGYRDICFDQVLPSAPWLAAFALVSAVLLLLGMVLFQSRAELYAELV